MRMPVASVQPTEIGNDSNKETANRKKGKKGTDLLFITEIGEMRGRFICFIWKNKWIVCMFHLRATAKVASWHETLLLEVMWGAKVEVGVVSMVLLCADFVSGVTD